MLKKLLLSMMACTAVLCASAQGLGSTVPPTTPITPINVEKPFVLSIGPKVGVGYNFATTPSDIKLDMKGGVGFNVGIAANLRFWRRDETMSPSTGWMGIQIEAKYALRKIDNDIENITYNCYSVPVLAQVYFLPNFCFEVGPTFTGALSASPKQLKSVSTTYKIDKYNDVMITFGLGYKSDKGFTAGVRYNMGTTGINKKFDSKISDVEISFGYLFNILK